MLKEHEKVSDVIVEVIDDFKAERANEQTFDTKASPEPCSSSLPMTVGQVPRTRYIPAHAPSEDIFHGLKVPGVREDQPGEIPDLRQMINKDDLRHKLSSKKKISSKEHANSETVFLNDNPIYTNSSILDLRDKLTPSRACNSSIIKTSSTSKQARAARGSNIHSDRTKADFSMSLEKKDKLSATNGDRRKVKVVNEAIKLNSVASTTHADDLLFTQDKDKGKIDRSVVSYDDLL